MKRKILFVSLITLLVFSFVLSGCFPKKATDDDNPLTVEERLMALEGNEPNYALKSELSPYATKADTYTRQEIEDFFEGLGDDFEDMLDDVAAPDLSGYVTLATYNELAARVEALEGTGGNGGTTPVVTGQVTAVFDPGQPAIVSGPGLPIQQFNIVITNGTANWQYVSYSLIFTLKTSLPGGATIADLDGTNSGIPLTLNTVFGTSLTFTPNFIESTPGGTVTQITFYPDHGIASAPGTSSSSILNYLNFNLPGGVVIQEWNCIIIPVYSISNW